MLRLAHTIRRPLRAVAAAATSQRPALFAPAAAAPRRRFSSSSPASAPSSPTTTALRPALSVHALHSASSVHALQQCIHTMLGFADSTSPSSSADNEDDADDAPGESASSPSDIVTISPAESIFIDPSKHVAIATLRYDMHAPIRPRMGAQLLTSSVYDLMFDRLVEFATRDGRGGGGGAASELASLGLRVLDHMRALQVRPSALARMSLLKLLALCRPSRWAAALPVWQGGLDEYLSGRGPKASKVFKPTISGMALASYTKLMIKALEAGGQPALALQVFRTVQAAVKSVAKPASASASPSLLHDEFSLDHECVALVLNAISMAPTEALLDEADNLFREALQAHMTSQAPTPLPSALFTPLIIAHASMGHLDRAVGLLRLQSRQRLSSHSLQDQPAIASVASKHDDRVPSAVAFVHVIAAAMAQNADELATTLWEQLHNAYPAPVDGQQPPASLPSSSSDSLPFALRTPPASSEFDDPVAASLHFHFSPLALKQFQAARSYLLLLRQRATAARPVLARNLEVVLGDFAMMGQSYLVMALLRDVRGLVPIPARDRIRRAGSAAAPPSAASSAAAAAEIPTEVANLFLQSCVSTLPVPQLAQAELIPRWLRAQGLRPNARTYLVLHQLYASKGLWDRSLALRENMDEVGEPLTIKQMEAMLIATARACMLSLDGKPEERALGSLPPGCLHPTSFAALSSRVSAHPQALEAWAAAQSLFAQFYASLITPAMHRVLLCAALAARQYAAALRIFQDQYNADLARQHALEEGGAPQENARQCYFRSQMTTELLNHLLLAARATHNPFMAAQIYSMMQSSDGFAVPAPRQAAVASSAASELAEQFAPIPELGRAADRSSGSDSASTSSADPFSSSSAEVEWVHSPTNPDVISQWILVGWVDELQERVFQTQAAKASTHSSSAPETAGRGRKSRSERPAASAAPTPMPEVQSSTAWLPTQPTRHEGRLRGAVWTPLTLRNESGTGAASAAPPSPAMLASVMQFCLDVEQYSHVVLATPRADPAEPVWPNATEASARPSVPFRVNLLALSQGIDPSLGMLRASAVLHLTMRHLSSLYLETGGVHELVIVHSAPSSNGNSNNSTRGGHNAASSSSSSSSALLDDSVPPAPTRSGRGVSDSEIQEAMLGFLESKRKPASASAGAAVAPNSFRVDPPAWAHESLPPPAPMLRASPALWRRSAVWPSVDVSPSSSSAPTSLGALAQSILEQYQLHVGQVGAEELAVSKQQMQSWMMGR